MWALRDRGQPHSGIRLRFQQLGMKEAQDSYTGLQKESRSLPSPSKLLPQQDTISLSGGMPRSSLTGLCTLGAPYRRQAGGSSGVAAAASLSPKNPLSFPSSTCSLDSFSVLLQLHILRLKLGVSVLAVSGFPFPFSQQCGVYRSNVGDCSYITH